MSHATLALDTSDRAGLHALSPLWLLTLLLPVSLTMLGCVHAADWTSPAAAAFIYSGASWLAFGLLVAGLRHGGIEWRTLG